MVKRIVVISFNTFPLNKYLPQNVRTERENRKGKGKEDEKEKQRKYEKRNQFFFVQVCVLNWSSLN